MLYVWIISLIFYRYTFFTLEPSDLMPPYWVNMGAMAISTLAGATLIAQGQDQPLVRALSPFVRGMSLLFWSTATWWIPMLLILGAWRHVYRRYRLAYDPLYWGAVFPLGMYSVCTHRLATTLELPFLFPLARAFAWIALAAWGAVFAGLLRSLAAGVLSHRPRAASRRP
jgi:tellurite resistance protein TehA-like permease